MVSNSSKGTISSESSSALRTMASARGCEAFASMRAASKRTSSPEYAATEGWPTVSVPVLSKTTVSMRYADSSASPLLMSMPLLAPTPVPTAMAVGVARPSAQGQATTSTAIMRVSEKINDSPLTPYHTAKVTSPIVTTAGTKKEDTRSANRCMGALVLCADSTNAIIWASMVSLPTFVARALKYPFWLMVAPMTCESTDFSTGMGSPEIIDSSTVEYPSVTIPSTGTFSPGFTTKISPSRINSTGISTSRPSRSTMAYFAWSATSFRSASEVLPFASSSIIFPKTTKVIIMAVVS